MNRCRVYIFAGRLRRDERGGVLLEFALLAPALFTLLIGILQVGLHVQNANAVRNLASDGARFAVVQYQLDRASSTDVIATWIRSRAVGSRYNLATDRLTVEVSEAATSRISGAREMQIEIAYDAPSYLKGIGGDTLRLDYQRPVFLLAPTSDS